jgi:hypothetical protein
VIRLDKRGVNKVQENAKKFPDNPRVYKKIKRKIWG